MLPEFKPVIKDIAYYENAIKLCSESIDSEHTSNESANRQILRIFEYTKIIMRMKKLND